MSLRLLPLAKAKWRIKLERAFDGKSKSLFAHNATLNSPSFLPETHGGGEAGKWVLFVLPLITVLREG